MGLAIPAGGIRPMRDMLGKRLPVAALVVILHIAVLALMQIHRENRPSVSEQETFFPLTPLVKKASPAVPKASPSAQKKFFGTFTAPAFLPAPKADLSDLGFLLNACAINNLGNVAMELRARCHAAGAGIDGHALADDFSVASKAKLAGQYAEEVKEKNAPLRVPCTYLANVRGASSPAIMVDPICAVSTLSNVFDRIRRHDY